MLQRSRQRAKDMSASDFLKAGGKGAVALLAMVGVGNLMNDVSGLLKSEQSQVALLKQGQLMMDSAPTPWKKFASSPDAYPTVIVVQNVATKFREFDIIPFLEEHSEVFGNETKLTKGEMLKIQSMLDLRLQGALNEWLDKIGGVCEEAAKQKWRNAKFWSFNQALPVWPVWIKERPDLCRQATDAYGEDLEETFYDEIHKVFDRIQQTTYEHAFGKEYTRTLENRVKKNVKEIGNMLSKARLNQEEREFKGEIRYYSEKITAFFGTSGLSLGQLTIVCFIVVYAMYQAFLKLPSMIKEYQRPDQLALQFFPDPPPPPPPPPPVRRNNPPPQPPPARRNNPPPPRAGSGSNGGRLTPRTGSGSNGGRLTPRTGSGSNGGRLTPQSGNNPPPPRTGSGSNRRAPPPRTGSGSNRRAPPPPPPPPPPRAGNSRQAPPPRSVQNELTMGNQRGRLKPFQVRVLNPPPVKNPRDQLMEALERKNRQQPTLRPSQDRTQRAPPPPPPSPPDPVAELVRRRAATGVLRRKAMGVNSNNSNNEWNDSNSN